jgi:hypothetical protein
MNYSTTSTELPPLQEHPTYVEGIAHVSASEWSQAIKAFQSLQPLYPDNREVKELLDEAQMRATLSRFQPEDRSKPKKRFGIRGLLLGLLVVIVIGITGFAAYEYWINPVFMREFRLRQITELRHKADEAIAAGNYALAHQTLQELQAIFPEDPETIEMLQRVEQVENSSQLYAKAKDLMAANSWDEAVETLTQLQRLDAQYRDLPQLLQTAQNAQALNRQFQAAEETFASSDWPAAIAQYQALQQTDLIFRFDEIQSRLFECHLRFGQSLLDKAGNEPDQVAQALTHFVEALKLRPLETEAINERRLAENYLAALNSTDQDTAIGLLQKIYEEQPAYAGQSAAKMLYATLLERADAFLEGGDTAMASADYQAAAQLLVEDPSEAEKKLAELNAK